MNLSISIAQMDVLVTLLGASLLFAFWVRAWQSFALDRLRQDLFDLRDDLFDRVRTGKSDFRFEDAAYKKTREDLNRMIRFVRHFGLFQIILAKIFARKHHKTVMTRAEKFKTMLTAPQAREVQDLDYAQGKLLVFYLMKTSPLFWFLAALVAVVTLAVGMVNALSRNFINLGDWFAQVLIVPIIRGIEALADQRVLAGRNLA